jgi:starch phosphorylase
VASSRGWYDPHWHYEHEAETRRALDMTAANYFSRDEPAICAPALDALPGRGDFSMHLADLQAYLRAGRGQRALRTGPGAIVNVACSGACSGRYSGPV